MTKREITVHQELSERLYGIEADQGQIEQMLLNLYINAVDAMPGSGDLFLKTINVTDKNMTGKLYKAKPGNYVLLTVIAPRKARRILQGESPCREENQ